ncbi:MAG: molybdenum cofactor guanylyltransferase [Vicinamibacterales bacterium]
MTCGAILTGGHARRFAGRDKSQLLVDGRTILARQVDALKPCVERILLVGEDKSTVQPGLTFVADRIAGCGPLGGLDAALSTPDATLVLLLACDVPNITTELCAHLVGLADGVDAVVPWTERGYHPLCAVYARSCRSIVRRRLDAGALRMRDLLTDLRVRTVDSDELARFGRPHVLLANINTHADLDALSSLSH